MSPEQIRATALAVLAEIAPEADLVSVDPAQSLQAQLDLDSFDFLTFVVALGDRVGVDVPERDFPQLATLDGCVQRLAGTATVG